LEFLYYHIFKYNLKTGTIRRKKVHDPLNKPRKIETGRHQPFFQNLSFSFLKSNPSQMKKILTFLTFLFFFSLQNWEKKVEVGDFKNWGRVTGNINLFFGPNQHIKCTSVFSVQSYISSFQMFVSSYTLNKLENEQSITA